MDKQGIRLLVVNNLTKFLRGKVQGLVLLIDII